MAWLNKHPASVRSASGLEWALVLTAAIGCAIVILMKGPIYTADSYPTPDADRPAPSRTR